MKVTFHSSYAQTFEDSFYDPEHIRSDVKENLILATAKKDLQNVIWAGCRITSGR